MTVAKSTTPIRCQLYLFQYNMLSTLYISDSMCLGKLQIHYVMVLPFPREVLFYSSSQIKCKSMWIWVNFHCHLSLPKNAHSSPSSAHKEHDPLLVSLVGTTSSQVLYQPNRSPTAHAKKPKALTKKQLNRPRQRRATREQTLPNNEHPSLHPSTTITAIV